VVPPSEHDDLRRGPVTAERRLFLALPAGLSAAAQVRARLGAWLVAHAWPDDQQDDLVLAVSEAVSNGVEHGYGVRPGADERAGVVEVIAEVICGSGDTRHAEITVRDHGKWRAHPRLRAHRRHGIPIMKACVAEFVIDGTATGTTVVMHSHPVPV
jgi:anti-sigma regulatory factor (Ser/Thr protein kinase)